MYREERRVSYSNAELIEALTLYCDASSRDFDFGETANLTFANTPTLNVTVSGWDDTEGSTSFDESEVAAGLIMFSKKVGIPIPRNASKSLELAPDNIILVMRIEKD